MPTKWNFHKNPEAKGLELLPGRWAHRCFWRVVYLESAWKVHVLPPPWTSICLLSNTAACFLQTQAGPYAYNCWRKTKEGMNTIQCLNKSPYHTESGNELNVRKNRQDISNMFSAFRFLKHSTGNRKCRNINSRTKSRASEEGLFILQGLEKLTEGDDPSRVG